MDQPRFIWKKSCDTCRKYKKRLDELGIEYLSREINSEPLSAGDVASLIGDRDVKPFLNTRNVVYREKQLSKQTPTLDQAVALIAETNNLLKRPIFMIADEYVIGNNFEAAEALLRQHFGD